jgi:hypothetical protein
MAGEGGALIKPPRTRRVGKSVTGETSARLTDHGDDEHDEEGVAHGHEGDGEGGEDLLGGLEAAEEADDAEGAEDADGEVEGAEGDEGHENDERIEDGPAVGGEVGEPVGEHVDGQLDGEDGGEGHVEVVEHVLDGGGGAVLSEEAFVVELRLDDGRAEVLRACAKMQLEGGPERDLSGGHERQHRNDQEGSYSLKPAVVVNFLDFFLHSLPF